MKRVLAVAFALRAMAGMAHGSGYDDFAWGLTANARGDSAAAIAAFSAALKASDLAPAYMPSVYRGRAYAYFGTEKCQEALADVNAAAALRPLDPSGYMLRARIEVCLEDFIGARQDLDTAMGPEPDATLYWNFGRTLWRAGKFDEAHANLLRSVELLDTKYKDRHAPYVLLWYAITASRVGRLDSAKLSARLDTIDPYVDWPMPIVKLYVGKLTPEKVWDRMDRPSSKDYAGQKCEADFYIGEWYLAHDNPEAGRKAITSAVSGCPKSYIEYGSAVAEAKWLGLPLPPKTVP